MKLPANDRKDRPLVAVVLVNYNGLEDSRECLLSLRDVEYPNMAVILVDNASHDGSLEILRDEFPEVNCVRSDRNLGFTGGNNLGLVKAYELLPEYIFLLNNDTIVSSNVLRDLTDFMETHADVGLAGPLTCYYEEREVVAFCGGDLNRNTGLVSFFNKGVKRRDISDPVIYCSFIEGAALFVRTEVVKKIGGFDDLYFLTSEESELCVRITDLGLKLAVVTSCCIWHKVSQSMGNESGLAYYFIFRNKFWFVKRNGRSPSLSDEMKLLRYSLVCLCYFIVRKRNFAAASGMIRGMIDYFRGVQGPGHYKVRLNA